MKSARSFLCHLACLLAVCQLTCRGAPALYIQWGDDVLTAVQQRISASLTLAAAGAPVIVIPADQVVDLSTLAAGSLVFSAGNTTLAASLLPVDDIVALGPEGFGMLACQQASVTVAVGAGNVDTQPIAVGGGGAGFAAYSLMSELGFAYLHPLQPLAPENVFESASLLPGCGAVRATLRAPYWPARGFHVHSQHPLELGNYLNGFGLNMSTNATDWQEMTPLWLNVLEWYVANYQNRVEWVILLAKDWEAYGRSAERQALFATMVAHAHSMGIAAGADVDIAEKQQNAFAMVSNSTAPLEEQIAEINATVDYFLEANFRFISTESGFSEFTHPSCGLMLAWINATAARTAGHWGRSIYIKCHCSTGQTCPDYDNINFNFLPVYATPEMNIMPHTVQFYQLNDPAPTYGASNFTFMQDFMLQQAAAGVRRVLFHPETTYWVNYDIDAALFLPIYGYNRLMDMRTIALAEGAGAGRIEGAMVFDSGWEFGYWLSDVICARAAFDPQLALADDTQAYAAALMDVTRFFGPVAQSLNDWLVDYTASQRQLLTFGLQDPANATGDSVTRLNGIAYLEGWDSFADIGDLSAHTLDTQPDRLGPLQARLDPFARPNYAQDVRPLLAAMNASFGAALAPLDALLQAPGVASLPVASLLIELSESATLTALRARQLFGLYDYAVVDDTSESASWRSQRLADAEAALASATQVMAQRVAAFRVPWVALWGEQNLNPTVYCFGYLWTASSLYYMWRDYAIATLVSPHVLSPCYLNIQNPIDTAIGEGVVLNVTELIYDLMEEYKWTAEFVAPCLEPPATEPVFPGSLNEIG